MTTKADQMETTDSQSRDDLVENGVADSVHPPPPGWPYYSDTEANIVSDVLLSNRVNYWTGTEGRLFEEEFAHKFHCKKAIALANGTLALEAALTALNISEGDEVIVTCRSFVASASTVLAVGAVPVFADVDRNSQNLSLKTVEPLISKKTRAIICVHLAGWPCDMDDLKSLADKHNIALIEDCAQAHGATFRGKPVGGFGDVGCWSFCQEKIISTAGEGGMVTTNREDLWEQMWSLKDHGKHPSLRYNPKQNQGEAFSWVHDTYGSNWRMTEIQAAIGRYQLNKLDQWSAQRRINCSKIWDCAAELPIFRAPEVPSHVQHAGYRATVFVNQKNLKDGWDRNRLIHELRKRNILVNQGTCPEIYREKLFVDKHSIAAEKRLKTAFELGESSLAFQVHPNLEENYFALTTQILIDLSKIASR